MKQILNIINQVFEVEKKMQAQQSGIINRNLDRIKSEFKDLGYEFHVPLHEKYDVSRTDCEANIVGSGKGKMVITDVIKPVIYYTDNGSKKIIQKAIVVVE